MFNLYKMLFMMTLMIGSMISISSYTWMGMWMGLEINLLSIIPLMSSSKNILKNEAALKYFITQSIASTILLFSIIMMSSKFFIIFDNFNMMFNSALLTKMGAAPFHFWFPEVMEGLNWMNCLILLTWQKLAPMVLIMYNNSMIIFFSIIIIISMMISGILGLNQISLRKLMAYSSINHIAWMISSMFFMESLWLMYFVIYSIISCNIIALLMNFNIYFMKQLFIFLNKNNMMKMLFIMNFLSLGGLPPFLGFMPKWMTIQALIENKFYMLTFIMMIMTLITLYFYMRITFSTMIINMNENNFYKNNSLQNWNFMFLNMISLMGLVFMTLIFNFY
uniref:NADH-ubiquinone oxidoreductase chain 2 n=1 Tax=Tympanogaster modulatrix TaxID=2107386 RepID=A0A7H0DL87_9COLE|nr:NADH dehydrogenase subunit 2 [Tympanogaster modulatrix]